MCKSLLLLSRQGQATTSSGPNQIPLLNTKHLDFPLQLEMLALAACLALPGSVSLLTIHPNHCCRHQNPAAETLSHSCPIQGLHHPVILLSSNLGPSWPLNEQSGLPCARYGGGTHLQGWDRLR